MLEKWEMSMKAQTKRNSRNYKSYFNYHTQAHAIDNLTAFFDLLMVLSSVEQLAKRALGSTPRQTGT